MRVYFIGIGGIGVSALAKYYLDHGHEIFGSDLASSEITDDLKRRGAKIFIGDQKPSNIPSKTDLVIFSPAVNSKNPEFAEAKRLRIKLWSYPEALGDLAKSHYTIAITGTHGKSTTTCMLGLLMQEAGLDPTVIVGTKLKEFGNSNYRGGRSKYLVIEACEHFESFLNYWPQIIVLTNIEADHLDYYKNISGVRRGFRKFISHLDKKGLLVANKDDKNVVELLKKIKSPLNYYSLRQPDAKKVKKFLKVPGSHNISNALAALTVARFLKIPDGKSFKALSLFGGSWRRFEEKDIKIKDEKYRVVSDYGHHPTEVAVTLKAVNEKYPKYPIWCIFQPHQYQRTYYLFKNFVKVFKKASVKKIIIVDIYDVAGREEGKIKKKVSSEKLVRAIKRKEAVYVPTILEAEKYLNENLTGKEIIVVMGAGDIYNLFLRLSKREK